MNSWTSTCFCSAGWNRRFCDVLIVCCSDVDCHQEQWVFTSVSADSLPFGRCLMTYIQWYGVLPPVILVPVPSSMMQLSFSC